MDLSQMMQYSPSFASQAFGTQVGMDQQMMQQKLRAAQLENDNSAAMNPLNQQFRQGQVAQQGAELPGVQAQSSMLGDQAKVSHDTLSQQVATKLSGMSAQIGVDGMKRLGADGEIMNQAAEAVKNVPPVMRVNALQSMIKQYGGDPNNPIYQGFYKTDPNKLPEALAVTGKGMALASQSYLQKASLDMQERNSREKIATGNNNTSIEVAKIQAASRETVAKERSQAVKHMTVGQGITYLTMLPDRTSEQDTQLAKLITAQKEIGAAGSNALAAQVLGLMSPQEIAAQGGTATPQAKPNTPSKQVVRTGTANGKKVIQYSDGTIEYAN